MLIIHRTVLSLDILVPSGKVNEYTENEEDDTMGTKEAEKFMPQAERKAIFLALVQAQDAGANVARSRKEIAERFAITERQMKSIEQEGIDGEWPPLDQ
jgi:hypothetical protein